ncbi:MAG: SMC family ATPase [Candidatus Thermoplasmatota archaeon]|nr:SMC family ATPase [Candidatus Thermoplasmatota archaeon]MBU1940711.1 SMC family ATPase [Candidatus Thermoplasmatota archaeon]
MILKSLHLTNFRKFKNTYLEFPDGVTGVIGFNGTGKSTIFEAIAWTLYGPTAARTGADTIKREHALTKDPCRVALEFIFNNDAYHIVREMTGKSLTAHATITINNKIIAQGADTVTRYIQKTLGMDFRSFYTSIFAKQKELNALSNMNPSERRPLILKMLGIDILDTLITEIRTDIRENKNRLEHLENETIEPDGTLKITQYLQEKSNLSTQQKNITGTTTNLETQIKTSSTKIQTLQQQTKHQQQTYEQLLKEKETLQTIKSQIEQRTQIQKNIQTLTQTITERKQKIKNLSEKKIDLSAIQKNIQTTDTTRTDITENIKEIIKKIERLHTTQKHLTDDIRLITEKKHNITTLGPDAHCPTCNRVLGSQHQTLLSHFTTEINQKNHEINTINQNLTNLQSEQDQYTKKLTALTKKITYLQHQQIEAEKIHSLINNLTEELHREETTITTYQSQLKNLESLSYNNEQYENLQKNIKETYTQYQTILQQTTNEQKNREDLRIELEHTKGKQNLINQQLQQLEKNILKHKELTKQCTTLKKSYEQLKILQEIMNGFRTYIISQIRPTLAQYASELFQQLTDGKYSAVELDDNYNLLIYDEGKPHQISRFSGGEEDLANLCIRLAISEVIAERAGSSFQFIILDEIFGSQDANRRHNIITTLNRFSAKFHQIFLITHVDEIKHFMENTLQVTENEDGISTVVIN